IGWRRTLLPSDALQMVLEKGERFKFAGSPSFLDDYTELTKLGFDSGQSNKVRARGQNRGFDDGMLGPVETTKIAQPTRMYYSRFNARSIGRVVDGVGSKLVITARVG